MGRPAKTKEDVEFDVLLKHLLSRVSAQELVGNLVNRVCAGMNKGDRFYHAKDKTWWEWHEGRFRQSGPPSGYKKDS